MCLSTSQKVRKSMTTHGKREPIAIPPQAASDPFEASEVTALRQELEALRAEIATIRTSLLPNASDDQKTSVLPSPDSSDTTNAITEGDASNEHESDAGADILSTRAITTSRRGLLKWGGVGAAVVAAAAGGASLTAQTAHAADGANLVLGT